MHFIHPKEKDRKNTIIILIIIIKTKDKFPNYTKKFQVIWMKKKEKIELGISTIEGPSIYDFDSAHKNPLGASISRLYNLWMGKKYHYFRGGENIFVQHYRIA